MFDAFVIVVSGACAVIIALFTFRSLAARPERLAAASVDLPAGITVREIGAIERDLAYLETVIVIADQVERPTDTLSEAVEHNFSRGVKYLFLVSADRAAAEVKGYYTIFEALARIVLQRGGPSTRQLGDLIQIQQLPYNWDDYPIIFYRVRLPSGRYRTLAFRGDQLHEGIAEHYGRLDPSIAHTIARAVVSDGPRNVAILPIERDQYETTSQAIQFDDSVGAGTNSKTLH